MKSLFTLLSLFITLNAFSQNLVPNHSFEDFDTCPDLISQINRATAWFQPSVGTPDYMNSCSPSQFVSVPSNIFGNQNARTGNAYAGFCAYMLQPGPIPPYREYIETQLINSLQPGQKYYINFYVSLADNHQFGTDDIAVVFSDNPLLNNVAELISATPDVENPSGQFVTDKTNWIKISGEYIAQGGEEYITIGNFKDDINTDTVDVGVPGIPVAYYYIDDVCVSIDSTLCSTSAGIASIDKEVISIFPNPFTDVLKVNAKTSDALEFILYDYKALPVLSTTIAGPQYIYIPFLSKGIYFYHLRNARQVIKSGKLFKE